MSYPLSITCPKLWIYQTACQAKPIKFIIMLYSDHTTFFGLPSKSQVFKSCFSTKWYVILHFFETVLVQTTTSHLTTCSQNQPYNIYQHCFPLYLARFTHAYFYIQLSLQSTLKAFSLPQAFSQFSLRQWPSEQGSLIVRTYTIPGFPKHGQGIKALTMTDPLLPRLKKLVFCW